MTDLPHEFEEEFESKRGSFFKIAETLYHNHGDQFTLDELAEEVGISKSQVSTHLGEPTDEDWVNKREGETTFVWNTEKYNPAETETTDAVFGLYTDLGRVLKDHAGTSTGTPAIAGLMFFVTASIMWIFYLGFAIGLFQNSVVPVNTYFVLGFALVITGVTITLLSPLLAVVNKLSLRVYRRWGQ